MQLIVDRIESEFLVVELPDGGTVDLPRCVAPEAGEGDVLTVTVDAAATEERRATIRKKMNRLFTE